MAVILLLIALESAAVEQHDAIDTRTRTTVYVLGAGLVLLLGAVAPAPWLLALLVVVVLSLTWLSSFVPPSDD